MKNTCPFTICEIFVYTIILGIAASFSHFTYSLSGENLIVGFFNPINESIWEHLKLMYFPFLLWWIVIYNYKNKKCKILLNTWITSAAIALVVAPMSVVLLYYSYTGAFGINSSFFYITLVFIAYFISLCIADHFLKYAEVSKLIAIISVIVIEIIFIAFIAFTIKQPELLVFKAM